MIDLKYFDTIRMLLRSGKTGDEYVQKTQPVKIVLGKGQLEEIPDFQYHVRVANYTELNESAYQRQKSINANQFYVNYENGMIYFNPSEEGKTVTVEYKGRGVIQYPAERIYVNNTEFQLNEQYPYVIDNLQQYSNFLVNKTKEFTQFVIDKKTEFTNFINEKVQLIMDRFSEYEGYVEDKRIEFTDYIDDYIDIANDKIDEMDIHIIASDAQTDACREQTEESIVETNKSKVATHESITATLDAIDQYNQVSDLYDDMEMNFNSAEIELQELINAKLATRLIMQSPVPTFAEISLTYPSPEIGWGVQVEENGNIYRWNGVHWSYAYNLQASIVPATETINGLMSTDQVKKLNEIEEKAQVNFKGEDAKDVLPTYFKTKTVVFILADELLEGTQGVYVQLPFNGKITGIRAFCKTTGSDNTIINIERATESGFLSDVWESMFEVNESIIIPTNSKVSMSYTLAETAINENDYLRVNITEISMDIRDITIQVNIQI